MRASTSARRPDSPEGRGLANAYALAVCPLSLGPLEVHQPLFFRFPSPFPDHLDWSGVYRSLHPGRGAGRAIGRLCTYYSISGYIN